MHTSIVAPIYQAQGGMQELLGPPLESKRRLRTPGYQIRSTGYLLDLVLCGEAKSARQLLAGQKDPVCSARESPPALLAWTHPAGTASARATAGKLVPLPARAFERSRI